MATDPPLARTRRPLRIAAASALLLAITVALGATLGVLTRAQFEDIEASWASYSGGAGRKGELLSEIRGYLGYGGIIHNFKNYVLRQDQIYRDQTARQLGRFTNAVTAFKALDLSQAEAAASDEILRTIARYETNLDVADRAIAEGWDPATTDRAVRIDDTAALAALAVLEDAWRQSQDASTARIVSSVTEGRTLIWIGFLSIAALVLAALTIGALIALLIRDLRRELAERRRLQQVQERLATVVEQSPATIVVTDTRARIQYVNAKFEALTGWSREEVAGKTPAMLQSGDTGAREYSEIRAQLAAGKPWFGVFRNLRKDGSSFWAETRIIPIKGRDGAVQNFVGIGEDITEARQARDQVVRAQKLEAVGQLAGGVAHDFNNVLTTIVGASHLAAMDAPEGSDLAHEIGQIDIAARRAQHLVRELLTFARREPTVPRPVRLNAVVEEVVLLLRAAVPPTVELINLTPAAPQTVMGDPTHLHQIIMNLCRNAAEALAGKPGQIRLTTGAADPPTAARTGDERWARLVVEDDGPGMSSDTLERIFEPFFTTKPIGKGSGLGLAVAYGLVEDMQGQITVESAPDAGTRFTVTFPAVDSVSAEVADVALDLPHGRERVLLVDDEAEVAGTFRRQLQRLGYRVEAFTHPRQALERFRSAPDQFDLVITDMVMPDLTGEDLASEIRALRADMPILGCSGYTPARISLQGEAVEMLQKPVDPGQFARQVRAVLDKSESLTA